MACFRLNCFIKNRVFKLLGSLPKVAKNKNKNKPNTGWIPSVMENDMENRKSAEYIHSVEA
ncbi:2543_t:CDS:2 [Acaulospora morrowiae]|uniref:2543_t:CDS:1 n=1 Tax=Acaulospora morrowiae TaxID=94023 RepID=A0A9N9C5A7_9GLOM|nr:2543_t:CDS:2 [Acaulospora morrowiae]